MGLIAGVVERAGRLGSVLRRWDGSVDGGCGKLIVLVVELGFFSVLSLMVFVLGEWRVTGEEEAQEKQQRADLALLEAKRMTSQYQKEAEKCDSGMDSCEAAREKAEKVVGEQRKHPAIWELRAREREWREGIIRSQLNQNFE
ncbi:hypothetical protein NC652_027205 [Populus alba x Populus x berolinensis]|nr:hypothetical protein NC652_027205 [Populus alba x Populus x berolinensis]